MEALGSQSVSESAATVGLVLDQQQQQSLADYPVAQLAWGRHCEQAWKCFVATG